MLRDRHRIEHLPAAIVQGRYDMVCPPLSAWRLAEGWEGCDLRLIPARPTLENYLAVFQDGRFPGWILNSLFIATAVTLSNVFFDSLVGYTLAKFKFRGRYLVFIAILSTLMIPTEMLCGDR